jgi:hypothetical protein
LTPRLLREQISPGQERGTLMVTGAITALILVAIIYGYVLLRPVPRIDADFGDRKVTFSTSRPAPEVFRIVETVGPSDSVKLGRSDAGRGRVILQDGLSWTSFGFYYPVDIAPVAVSMRT